MLKQFLFSFIVLLSFSSLYSQIDGDNIFANDQVVSIELTFKQTNFWDSLTTNYETETYMKADLELTDETGTYSFPDVGIRLKGNSSYGHPGNKKSFKIDFNKYVSGQDYDGIKKLNFSNGFKDPSLMREKIFFDVARAVGVPAPRANFANVYFNGTLWGFYTIIEQIDDQFLDWKIKDDDGNLFKAGANFGNGPSGGGNPADLKYYGEAQSSYEERYELKTNEDENDWSDLIELVSFIDNTSATEFENNLANVIELDDYLKSAALDNLFSNLDSYTNSARNYYIYHNLTTDKWEWIKWDGNESFGTYAAGIGGNNITTLALNFSATDRPLLQNIFSSTTLYEQYKNALCQINLTYFDPSYMEPKIDGLKELIAEFVYADTNKQYSDANFNTNIESNVNLGGGGPGGGTVYGLKSFTAQKYSYVTGELTCTASNYDWNQEPEFKIFPNPTSEVLNIQFETNQNGRLTILNSVGQVVKNYEIEESKALSINITDLFAGLYFVQFQPDAAEGKTSFHKLIKE